MVRIKKYNDINESVRDYLKPISKEVLLKQIEKEKIQNELFYAAESGNLNRVKELVKMGANPMINYVLHDSETGKVIEESEQTPLELADMNQHKDVVRFFLKSEKIRNKISNPFLMYMMINNMPEKGKLLDDEEVDIWIDNMDMNRRESELVNLSKGMSTEDKNILIRQMVAMFLNGTTNHEEFYNYGEEYL